MLALLCFDAVCLIAAPCFLVWRVVTTGLDSVRDWRAGVVPAWRRR